MKPCWRQLGQSWDHVGTNLSYPGANFTPLHSPWSLLEPNCNQLGRILTNLGALLKRLGANLSEPGTIFDEFRTILGPIAPYSLTIAYCRLLIAWPGGMRGAIECGQPLCGLSRVRRTTADTDSYPRAKRIMMPPRIPPDPVPPRSK